MKHRVLTPLLAIALSLLAAAEGSKSEHFSDWPKGASPAEVGKRIAENVIPRKFRFETMPEKASLGVIYPEVIAWCGALTVAQLTCSGPCRWKFFSKPKTRVAKIWA